MNRPRLDLSGARFGRLIAQAPSRSSAHGVIWACLCDCGSEALAASGQLTSGKTRSCGCLSLETSRAAGKANRTHGMTNSTEYTIWRAMRIRCENADAVNYQWYGGRGIAVCERWNSFENFYADMGPRPPGRTLDRYPDRDGNYELGNCRWATLEQQNNNRSCTPFLNAFGRVQAMADWAREYGIKLTTLKHRMLKGMEPESALLLPVRPYVRQEQKSRLLAISMTVDAA